MTGFILVEAARKAMQETGVDKDTQDTILRAWFDAEHRFVLYKAMRIFGVEILWRATKQQYENIAAYVESETE